MDPATGHMLLFGGLNANPDTNDGLYNDTWIFDGHRWIQQFPVHVPPLRGDASAAFDAADDEVVLFGGLGVGGVLLNDTWTWNGSDWTEQHPSQSPMAREFQNMAYDPATDRVVLFGGWTCVPVPDAGCIALNDTWTWDGSQWTQQVPAVSPPARFWFGFADGGSSLAPTLFGGDAAPNGLTETNDTWTWDGTSDTWLPALTTTAPPARAAAGFEFDPALGKDVLFGGFDRQSNVQQTGAICNFAAGYGDCLFDDTWTWDGLSWTQLAPPVSPPQHYDFSMSFDPVTTTLYLFGGVFQSGAAGGFANDTWGFDGTTWTQEDLNAPDELVAPMLAREPQLDTAILFGGVGEYTIDYSNQTWRWDGSWHLLDPAGSPPPRAAGAMVFDPRANDTVLFGGLFQPSTQAGTGSAYVMNDTWTWDGYNWTERNPTDAPTARAYPNLVYDAAHNELLLFGGSQSATGGPGLNDTWEWDGTDWRELHPAHAPSARYGADMTYDPSTQTVVLFGGIDDNNQLLNDTWTWDGMDWTEQQTGQSPPPRYWGVSAFDPASGDVVAFGGCVCSTTSDFANDTWAWDGTNWNQVQTDHVPLGRVYAAAVDGTASSPLLMFGGESPYVSVLDAQGTVALNDLWAFGAPEPPGSVVPEARTSLLLPVAGTLAVIGYGAMARRRRKAQCPDSRLA
jgi:hypothetical protein